MNSPISWFGGKGMLAPKLVPLIPDHKIYVEPFGGGASLLFAKVPSAVEIYNDVDSGLVGFYRVLRDPKKFETFHRLIELHPYSREEFYKYRDSWRECENEVERAYRWFVVAKQSFSGDFGGSWSFSVTQVRRDMASATSKWLTNIAGLAEAHARMKTVEVECIDFRRVFDTYDSVDTFFYCDPPYIHETRDKTSRYEYEIDINDHVDLVNILLGIKGKAMVSGYIHSAYEPLSQAGWKRVDFQTFCHAAMAKVGTKKPSRVESVWISPRGIKQLELFQPEVPIGEKE